MKQKGSAPILIFWAVVILIVTGIGVYIFVTKSKMQTQLNLLPSSTPTPIPSNLMPMKTQSNELNPEEQNKILSVSPTPSSSPIFSTGDVTEDGNGKTFTYPIDDRFTIDLNPNKHPFKNLKIPSSCPFGGVSNLDTNGPDSYPWGFQTTEPGSCVVTNGDFSTTIKVMANSN